jgi:DNA-binding IclR family transcriptional regulator
MSKSLEREGETKRDFSQVQVINRAVSILRAVRDSGGLNLSQLSREVGLARSTVFRIVATLESEGLLATGAPGEHIQLGTELVSFGAAVHMDMRHELRPYLEELSLKVDETVDLSILNKEHLLFLDQVARPQRLRAVSGVGISFPLYCTAPGKALLSTLPLEEVTRIVPEQIQAFTAMTLTTRENLLKELNSIRAIGVAYDKEEHTLGICAVSLVVRGPLNTKAALSIPVPSVRFYGNEVKLVSALLETRDAIDSRYGSVINTYSFW